MYRKKIQNIFQFSSWSSVILVRWQHKGQENAKFTIAHKLKMYFMYIQIFQICCSFFFQQVTLRLKGQGLGSTRCCIFPSSIFYILSKVNEDGSYIVVYRSEGSPGDTPSWLPVTISIRSLCNGDKDRGLQFHFFQEGFNGYHTSLGYILTSVNRMKSSPDGSHVKLIGKNGKVSKRMF